MIGCSASQYSLYGPGVHPPRVSGMHSEVGFQHDSYARQGFVERDFGEDLIAQSADELERQLHDRRHLPMQGMKLTALSPGHLLPLLQLFLPLAFQFLLSHSKITLEKSSEQDQQVMREG